MLKNTVSVILLLAALAAAGLNAPLAAQDTSNIMAAGEEVNENYLNLAHETLSIWPPISDEMKEVFSKSINDLIAVYEAELRDARMKQDDLKGMVEQAKKNEDIVKAKIDVADKAEDPAEKERLEALKDTQEDRRKYLEQIRKIREQEKKVSEVRVEYWKAMRETFDAGIVLSNERADDNAEARQLLGLEEDLIMKAKKAAELNDKVGSEAKKLNGWRMDAFKERQKILDYMAKSEAGTE